VLRNDSTTAWEGSSYKLRSGEVGVGYMDVYKKDASGNFVYETKENGQQVKVVEKKVPIIKVGDGEHVWSDLPQAEGVFENDISLTYSFGKYQTSNGKKISGGGAGMTTSEWIKDALAERKYPKTNYPSVTFGFSSYTTDTDTNEIGSKITSVSWTATAGAGSYKDANNSGTYGTTNSATSNATGIDVTRDIDWDISNENDDASVTRDGAATDSGTFTFAEADYITINSTTEATYTYLNATATINPQHAYTPLDNLGDQYSAGKIAGFDAQKNTTKSFTDIAVKATGYRNSWYYVGTDKTSTVTGDWIRTNGTAMGTSSPNFNIHSTSATGKAPDGGAKCMRIPGGTKRVLFAVPGKKTKLTCSDVDGMGLGVQGFGGVQSTDGKPTYVRIKGYDGFVSATAQSIEDNDLTILENKDGYLYSVFVKESDEGLAATGFSNITIS
jgi:hypothetical protein